MSLAISDAAFVKPLIGMADAVLDASAAAPRAPAATKANLSFFMGFPFLFIPALE